MNNNLGKINQKKQLINSFMSDEQLNELVAEFKYIREKYNLLPAQLEDVIQYSRMVALLPTPERKV